MSSRKDILAAIRRHKPSPSGLPDIPPFERPDDDLMAHFCEVVEKVGGKVLRAEAPSELADQLARLHPEARQQWSADSTLLTSNVAIDQETSPASLAGVDVALVKGTLGVAENGAIWVPEESLPQRVLAFITQHLILVLREEQVVWNMHEAYGILGTDLAGFGLFISGPSKTADIEQSLVVGAHGPRSLTVCLVKKDL